MKRLVYIFPVLLLLAACGDKTNLAQELTLANETIASSAVAATRALNEGHISVKQACKIEAYGRVAGVMIDQAWINWFLGNPDTAEAQLDAAISAINGTLPAARQAAADC